MVTVQQGAKKVENTPLCMRLHNPGRIGPFLCFFICCFLGLSFLSTPAKVAAQDQPSSAGVPAEAVSIPLYEKLWNDALNALDLDNRKGAAALFYRSYMSDPGSEKAEEALWRAAQLSKEVAIKSRKPDWEMVRNLFKMYTTYFPDSERYQEAYFEVGQAHFHMGIFRDALVYFNLFLKRFPKSALLPDARYWKANALFKLGQLDEAEKVFQELSRQGDEGLRVRAIIGDLGNGGFGLGDIQSARGRYLDALQLYENIKKQKPVFHLEHPELLLKMGRVYFNLQDEVRGCNYLFYFLNLAEQSPLRTTVIFELAESFYRQDNMAALKLYDKAMEEGEPGDRPVVLSRFRKAQYLDDPKRALPKWQKRGDLTDPKGDSPYEGVVEYFEDDPLAQEARYGLFLRYMARGDVDNAYDIGEEYLGHVDAEIEMKSGRAWAGRIVVYLAEELLKKKEYQEVYQLYRVQQPYVVAYPRGRLLYLVGKALEALSLYDQAAVVYYRALGLPLSDAEKIDLYYRRAEVYLAMRDYASADRLLTHLRKTYKDTKEAGEIYSLSGRFSEVHSDYEDALSYYADAARILTFPDKRAFYGRNHLRMLFALEKYDKAAETLAGYRQEDWFSVAELQDWYGRLGEAFCRRKKFQAAADALLVALDESMPQDTEIQPLQVCLGDSLFQLGRPDEGRAYYQKAKLGNDPLWKKLASERLQQNVIAESVSELRLSGD